MSFKIRRMGQIIIQNATIHLNIYVGDFGANYRRSN